MEEPAIITPTPTPKRGGKLIILLVLVVGLLAGAGLVYFLLVPHDKAATTSPSPAPTPSPSPTAEADPTAAWTAYANAAGHYSLRYNPAWKTRVCPDNPRTLFLAPSDAALGKCNSGFGGQMMVMSADGDQRTSYRYGAGYADLVTTPATIAGITGERQSATVTASPGVGPEPGTKLVQYILFDGTRTYLATYQQTTSGDLSTDVLGDFDLMMHNTLKL